MHFQSPPATPISQAKAVIQGRSPQTSGRRICRAKLKRADQLLSMSSDLGRDCSVEQQIASKLGYDHLQPAQMRYEE